MTDSQRAVLNVLQTQTNPTTGTGIQAFSIASRTGQPEPSMRRNVQELRRLGYDIRVSPWRGYVLYNQGVTPVTKQRGF